MHGASASEQKGKCNKIVVKKLAGERQDSRGRLWEVGFSDADRSRYEGIALIKSDDNRIIELEVPDQGSRPVMIREIQRDALNREILHVDFREINLNQPIKTTVRIDYSGHSPGVEHGGILQVQMHEIEVEALPQRIPSAIEADMSSLDLGGHLLAGDLSAPEGVKIVTNPEEVIATILTPREEETLEPEAEAADEGEPGLAEKDEAKPLQTE